jgi:hypothetical protein
MELMQYVESSRSFSVTLSLLRSMEPGWLIIVATDSTINQACRGKFQQLVLPRSAFDDTKGQDLVAHYALPSTTAPSPAFSKAYYLAFGAAGALLQNIDEDHPFTIAPGSLDVSYRGPSDFLQLDTATAQVYIPLWAF